MCKVDTEKSMNRVKLSIRVNFNFRKSTEVICNNTPSFCTTKLGI